MLPADSPRDPQQAFELARSLQDSGNFADSLLAYRQRIAADGPPAETWYAMLQVAEIQSAAGAPSEAVIASYLSAYDFLPDRAESLGRLAAYCRKSGARWYLAQLFADQASRLPLPVDRLHLDPSWHQWRALDELAVASFHTGGFAAAAAINEKLLAGGHVPAPHQSRIRENLVCCRAELAKQSRDANAGGEVLPVWMHEVEVEQVLEALRSVSPRRILEWGAGGSTRLFLERLEGLRTLHSIEHDAAWSESVARAINDARLDLHHVLPNEAPPAGTIHDAAVWEWASRAERDPAIMRDYVSRARSLGGEFDAVFVDGRARSFCIRVGFDLLRPGGVLVLHDAQRADYHESLHAVGRPQFLPGWRQGQVCVLRKQTA